MRKKIQAWIAMRLWRQLMFSHLLVVLIGFIVVQVAFIAWLTLGTEQKMSTTREASLSARAMADALSGVLENKPDADLTLILSAVAEQAVLLPQPDLNPESISIVDANSILEEDWPIRLISLSVLDQSGTLIAAYADNQTRQQFPDEWQALISLAQQGERDPENLSQLLNKQPGNVALGTAAIYDSQKNVIGIVAVEMRPHWIPRTPPLSLTSLLNFIFLMLISSVLLGLPVLVLAMLLALLSGVIVSRNLSQRLKALEESAQTIAGGELSLRISDTSPDEIGQVGEAFNQMAEQLAGTLSALEAEKTQVETLLKARRDMIANISHDLRTPIASLSAHLETLASHPERLEAYLKILNAESSRIARLIEDLFELSRLDAHEVKLHNAPLILEGLIDKVVDNYKETAWTRHRIVLERLPTTTQAPVWADVQRVEQVLVNLITNALRYTPEGGIVTIETCLKNDGVKTCVRDSGIGISAEDLPHVFERFYRGDRARTEVPATEHLGSGSGLGLAIVKGLIEALHGSINIESQVDEGTCICFQLPLATQEQKKAA